MSIVNIYDLEVGNVFKFMALFDHNNTNLLLLEKKLHVPEEGFFIGATIEWLDLVTNEKMNMTLTHEGPIFMVLNESHL